MENAKIYCFSCSKQLDLFGGQKVSKNEECPYCYASIHSCRMCHHYEVQAYNQCREPNAERIVEKEKANYCDYFSLNLGKGQGDNSKDDLLKKAHSLFKD